jgi:hypothetical protein
VVVKYMTMIFCQLSVRPFKVSAAKASAGIGGGKDDDATSVCMKKCENRR